MHPGFENPFGELLIGTRSQETQILFCFLLSVSLCCPLGFRFLMDQRGKNSFCMQYSYSCASSVLRVVYVWMCVCECVCVCVEGVGERWMVSSYLNPCLSSKAESRKEVWASLPLCSELCLYDSRPIGERPDIPMFIFLSPLENLEYAGT